MARFIIKLFRFLSRKKFSLKKFSYAPVVILDATGESRLLPIINKLQLSYQKLRAENVIYLRYFFRIRNFSHKSLLEIYLNYLEEILNDINPKLVINYLDNDSMFQKLDQRTQKKYKFLTIQNGSHFVAQNHENIPKGYEHWFLRDKPFFSNYVCFSKFDYDYYISKDSTILNYFPIGFLHQSQYVQNSNASETFDICVIAQDEPIDNEREKYFQYLKRFHTERNVSMCVALKYGIDHPTFSYHFNQFRALQEESNIIIIPRNGFSSHYLADASKVTIGRVGSTAIRQIFSRGNRVYPLNFAYKIISPPFENFKYHLNPSYEEFSSHLDFLLRESDYNYHQDNKQTMQYLGDKNSKESAEDKLTSLITEFIHNV